MSKKETHKPAVIDAVLADLKDASQAAVKADTLGRKMAEHVREVVSARQGDRKELTVTLANQIAGDMAATALKFHRDWQAKNPKPTDTERVAAWRAEQKVRVNNPIRTLKAAMAAEVHASGDKFSVAYDRKLAAYKIDRKPIAKAETSPIDRAIAAIDKVATGSIDDRDALIAKINAKWGLNLTI